MTPLEPCRGFLNRFSVDTVIFSRSHPGILARQGLLVKPFQPPSRQDSPSTDHRPDRPRRPRASSSAVARFHRPEIVASTATHPRVRSGIGHPPSQPRVRPSDGTHSRSVLASYRLCAYDQEKIPGRLSVFSLFVLARPPARQWIGTAPVSRSIKHTAHTHAHLEDRASRARQKPLLHETGLH